MGKVQRLTSQMLGVLGNSQGPLDKVTETVQEAYRVAGLLITASDDMLSATTKQVTTLQRMRREVAPLLPPEVTGPMPELGRTADGMQTLSSDDLRGLGIAVGETGLTGTFEVVAPDDGLELPEGHTPLTVPMNVLDSDQSSESEGGPVAPPARPEPSATTEALAGLWALLVQLDAEMSVLDGAVAKLAREASSQSRSLRSADADIAFLRQSVAVLKGHAENLQQLAGAGLPMPPLPDGLDTPTTRPLAPEDRLSRGSESPAHTDEHEGHPRTAEASPPPETLAELGGSTPAAEPDVETPAPGSLRMADLLNFDGDFSKLEDGDQS
jgi:hypothetical protein